MLSPKLFLNFLKKKKINFFCGVPDSVLKNFTNYLSNQKKIEHVISTNEGSAVSLGIGTYLATKKIPCVYMQNSGLGNAFNPLISIANKKVYSIPLILIIGWRGHPKKKDEPQHQEMGKITVDTLKLLKINSIELKDESSLKKIAIKIEKIKSSNGILAILVPPNIITKFENKKNKIKSKFLRYDFLKIFLELLPKKSKIISTTGYTSREVYQIRNEKKLNIGKDFYMVGGMGHSSILSLGYSLKTKYPVFCLDGDGALLMHMGTLRTISVHAKKNLKHILFNNNSHESVGGQTTHSYGIKYKDLIKSIGYKNYFKIQNKKKAKHIISKFLKSNGPSFLEVVISNGTLTNLKRPKNLNKIKHEFMNDK